MRNANIEELLGQFEDELISGENPDISLYLDQCGTDREFALAEFLHTDLELRIKAGEPKRVESYYDSFPEIVHDPDLMKQLMITEYRVRSQFEPGIKFQEFVVRFPGNYSTLIGMLGATSSSSESTLPSGVQPSTFEGGETTGDVGVDLSRFRKKRLVEQGGLGNIWTATDSELNRTVALKEIKAKYANHASFKARFQREALLTGMLEHPSIVPVYGYGSFADGTPFYAMRYVHGESYKQRIKTFHDQKNSLSHEDRAIEFRGLLQHFLDACNAIHFANSRGIVHRDIKPSNVMIGRYGETVVVDWGLAKVEDEPGDDDRSRQTFGMIGASVDQTLAGQIVGSPGFMSPEQAEGSQSKVTIKSDVYSLGAMLVSVVTGDEHPNQKISETSGRLRVASIPSEYRPLISICQKAMNRDPQERYENAEDLSKDVQRFLAKQKAVAHKESAFEFLRRASQRYRAAFAIGTFGLAAIAIVSGVGWWNVKKEKDRVVASNIEADNALLQLIGTIEMFSSIFQGPGACGYLPNSTLVDGLDTIKQNLKRIDQEKYPLVVASCYQIFAQHERGKLNFDESKQWYEQSIALLESVNQSPTKDRLLAQQKGSLTTLLYSMGDLVGAEALVDEVDQLCQNHSDKFKTEEFQIATARVPLLLTASKTDEAVELAQKSIVLGHRAYPGDSNRDHIWLAEILLMKCYLEAGQPGEFVKTFERVLNEQEEHPEKVGPIAKVEMASLAVIAAPKADKLKYAKIATDVATETMGANHPKTLRAKMKYERYLPGNSFLEARQLLEDVYAAYLENFDLDDLKVIFCVERMARRNMSVPPEHADLGRAAEVLSATLDAVEKNPKGAGDNAEIVAKLYFVYAKCLEKSGKIKEACDVMLTKSIPLSEQPGGEESSLTGKLRAYGSTLQQRLEQRSSEESAK